MFERYTEAARRALFFSRYEASQHGSRSIGTEHLLLALLRQQSGLLDRILTNRRVTYDEVVSAIQSGPERLATSVEMPFTEEMKRVLTSAMKEADRLGLKNIEVEHLLLGLLHEPQSFGGRTLREHGLELDAMRDQLVTSLNEVAVKAKRTETDELLELVDTIEVLAGDLAALPAAQDVGPGKALLSAIQLLRRRLEERRR
jgi:ATP-dependent Clp protease ATP-binding subunit ClpC